MSAERQVGRPATDSRSQANGDLIPADSAQRVHGGRRRTVSSFRRATLSVAAAVAGMGGFSASPASAEDPAFPEYYSTTGFNAVAKCDNEDGQNPNLPQINVRNYNGSNPDAYGSEVFGEIGGVPLTTGKTAVVKGSYFNAVFVPTSSSFAEIKKQFDGEDVQIIKTIGLKQGGNARSYFKIYDNSGFVELQVGCDNGYASTISTSSPNNIEQPAPTTTTVPEKPTTTTSTTKPKPNKVSSATSTTELKPVPATPITSPATIAPRRLNQPTATEFVQELSTSTTATRSTTTTDGGGTVTGEIALISQVAIDSTQAMTTEEYDALGLDNIVRQNAVTVGVAIPQSPKTSIEIAGKEIDPNVIPYAAGVDLAVAAAAFVSAGRKLLNRRKSSK